MAQRTWVVLGGLVVALSFTAIGVASWRLSRVRTPVLHAEPLPSPPKVPEIEVTRTQIKFDGEKLLDLDSLEAQTERGVAPEWKDRSPEAKKNRHRFADLTIVPLVSRLKSARSIAPGQAPWVQLARDVPYRVLVDVTYSANAVGYPSQRLSAGADLELVSTAPRPGQLPTVTVSFKKEGFSVRAFLAEGRNAESDCTAAAPGLAIDGNTSFKALAACLRAVRKAYATAPVGAVAGASDTSAWQALSVGNVLRCGEPNCPKTWLGPDFYDAIHFVQTGDSGAPSERAHQVGAMRPALRACYQAELQRGGEMKYEVAAELAVKTEGNAELKLTPSVPATLDSCLRLAFADLLADVAKEPVGYQMKVPLTFVTQGSGGSRP